MAEPKGPIVLICGINPDGTLRTLEVDANDYLKVAIESPDLSGLMTELEQKLETVDLDFDGSGYLNVNVQTGGGGGEVTQDTPDNLRVGPYGWIGGSWQKSPLPFGFSGVTKAIWETDPLVQDTNYVHSAAVPAGEIHVATNISFKYTGTSPDHVHVALGKSGNYWEFTTKVSPVSGIWYGFQGNFILEEDETITLMVYGATAGDDCGGRYLGYRMDIDQ